MNPKTLSWVNSTQGQDQSGTTVPWDASTDGAGIEIQLDGGAVASVPLVGGVQTFDLTTLAAYNALSAGQHTLAMAFVTKEGAVSEFVQSNTFSTGVVPLAPTAVKVA